MAKYIKPLSEHSQQHRIQKSCDENENRYYYISKTKHQNQKKRKPSRGRKQRFFRAG